MSEKRRCKNVRKFSPNLPIHDSGVPGWNSLSEANNDLIPLVPGGTRGTSGTRSQNPAFR